jgi:hypothetical protein
VAFPKEKLLQRIERFTSFLNEREGFTCRPIDSTEKGNHYHIVCSGTELAMAIFTYTGGVRLTAPPGRLKELLLTWVAQEVCPFYDSSSPGELAKLDPYRYLIKESDTVHDPDLFPPPGALQLMPQDNPLVELAGLLGYVVYLLAPLEPKSPRFGVANQQEMVAQGNTLAQVLAQLITGQPTEDPTGSSTSFSQRKTYLPKGVKYPLGYWRKQTRMPGSSWMTQQTLANLADLDVHTVRMIEQVRCEPDQTHVYLSTAKSILAALNEVREQQQVPLLQLWNIDWTPEELDEE